MEAVKMSYTELTDLVAKGMNFKKNACIVGTAIDTGENLDMTVFFDGNEYNVHSIMECLITNYLLPLDDETAYLERDCLIEIIEKDKRRRLREGY